MQIAPPQRTVTLIRIRTAVAAFLLSTVFALLGCFATYYFFVLSAVAVAAGLFILFFYIPRLIGGVFAYLSDKGIYVKYGVFIKTERFLPGTRYVYAETRQTPLAAAFGLCAVRFSGAKARIALPEIDKRAAERIISLCGGFKEDDGVE